MYEKDTIAAISTAVGPAGIAIVRVSGGAVRDIAKQVFRGWPQGEIDSHRLHPGRIVDATNRTVDRGLAVLMLAPRSYTGEDVLELHGHGGVAVARAMLSTVLAAGARLAERGEFTARAFLNGKLDLTQVEAVADLIAARTDEAARLAGAQLDGALSERVSRLRDELIEIAARLEAAIDFADEEGTALDRSALARLLDATARDLHALRATYEQGRLLREGVKVVIAGKPNVGKSSLANRLLGMDRVIVTPFPGTTRDTIEETLDLDGVAVTLVDTAGLRETTDVVERFGIERTQSVIAQSDLALLVIDGSRTLDDEDRAAARMIGDCRKLLVLNKTDLPPLTGRHEIEESFPGSVTVATSAMTRSGIAELRHRMRESIGILEERQPQAVLTRERHRVAVEQAMQSLAAAESALIRHQPPEIVALGVTAASEALAEIIGVFSNEQVLDRLFLEFCVGK